MCLALHQHQRIFKHTCLCTQCGVMLAMYTLWSDASYVHMLWSGASRVNTLWSDASHVHTVEWC